MPETDTWNNVSSKPAEINRYAFHNGNLILRYSDEEVCLKGLSKDDVWVESHLPITPNSVIQFFLFCDTWDARTLSGDVSSIFPVVWPVGSKDYQYCSNCNEHRHFYVRSHPEDDFNSHDFDFSRVLHVCTNCLSERTRDVKMCPNCELDTLFKNRYKEGLTCSRCGFSNI